MAAKPNRGLGRGLESLIPSAPKKNQPKDAVKETSFVEISSIAVSRYQPRRRFEESALKELSESIKEQGIIQPLVVCPVKDGKNGAKYELIAGERRWRAAQLAGLKAVPVVIKEVSDKQHLQMALVENIQREDLTPIEEALAYQRLMQEFSLTQEEMSVKVGKGRAVVANTLRLLTLPQNLQDAVSAGSISAGHARNLVSVSDAEEQKRLAEKILTEHLTVRDIERIVAWLKKENKISKEPVFNKTFEQKDADVRRIEDALQQFLGTKVRIHVKGQGKKLRGSIKIDYFSLEDFERLVDLISPNNPALKSND